MEEHGDCMSGVCPGASVNGETVSLYVSYHHPLLRLQRALPWEALSEVMTRHWRQAGKNVDGHRGLAWDIALYGPLVAMPLKSPCACRLERRPGPTQSIELHLGLSHGSGLQ